MRSITTSRRWASLGSLALLSLGASAAPASPLTTRAIEDPAVLPRGLAALSVSASFDRLEATREWAASWDASFRYGITDRLELDNLGLRYALLDDAPPTAGAARAPLTFVVHAGLEGIGYSTSEGLVLLPVASVRLGKHLGTRVYVASSLSWDASWVSAPQPRAPAYTAYLRPNSGRVSQVTLSTSATVQVVDHLVLKAGVSAAELGACTLPDCGWGAAGLGAWLGPTLRPWRWLDVGVEAVAGERWRPATFVTPERPGEPVPLAPPRHVSWVGVGGELTVRW